MKLACFLFTNINYIINISKNREVLINTFDNSEVQHQSDGLILGFKRILHCGPHTPELGWTSETTS